MPPLLDACKEEVKTSDPVQIGSYQGFDMSVAFDAWRQEYTLLLKGQMTHRTALGTDPRGNLTRIDNALSQMPQRLESTKANWMISTSSRPPPEKKWASRSLYEDDLRVKIRPSGGAGHAAESDGRSRSQPESVVAKVRGLRCWKD